MCPFDEKNFECPWWDSGGKWGEVSPSDFLNKVEEVLNSYENAISEYGAFSLKKVEMDMEVRAEREKITKDSSDLIQKQQIYYKTFKEWTENINMIANKLNEMQKIFTQNKNISSFISRCTKCSDQIKLLNDMVRTFSPANYTENTDPVYHNGRGHQYRNLGQFKKALVHYSSAIKLSPDNMDYYYNRAVCYRKLEGYEDAISDYSVVIKSDPKDAVAFYERGICYMKTSSHQKAMDDFNNAIRLKPSIDEDCYMCRAVTCCILGDKNGAIIDLEYVLRFNPNNPIAAQMLSQIRRL